MKDGQIVALYQQRDEGAIQKSTEKYGRYCYSVAYALLENHEDAEECVSDTWMRAWGAIPPNEPQNLKLYLARITRNLAFNKRKEQSAQKRGGGELALALDELELCLPSSQTVEEEFQAEELRAEINAFMRKLSARDRDIFLRRYFFVDSTADIADRYHMKESNVLMILSRTRKKLKSYLEKEWYIR